MKIKTGPKTVEEALLIAIMVSEATSNGNKVTPVALEAAITLCDCRVEGFDVKMPFDEFSSLLTEVLKELANPIPDVFTR